MAVEKSSDPAGAENLAAWGSVMQRQARMKARIARIRLAAVDSPPRPSHDCSKLGDDAHALGRDGAGGEQLKLLGKHGLAKVLVLSQGLKWSRLAERWAAWPPCARESEGVLYLHLSPPPPAHPREK